MYSINPLSLYRTHIGRSYQLRRFYWPRRRGMKSYNCLTTLPRPFCGSGHFELHQEREQYNGPKKQTQATSEQRWTARSRYTIFRAHIHVETHPKYLHCGFSRTNEPC